jgi:acyl-CoA synthetase (AMP-forming)/AMP-acid ligase II
MDIGRADAEERKMTDTIYSLFKHTAEEHKNEPAIIETGRTLTFGQLSDLADIIAGSFPEDVSSVGRTAAGIKWILDAQTRRSAK